MAAESLLSRIRRPLLTGLAAGGAIVLAVLMWGDARAVGTVLARMDLRLLPALILLAPLNYALRYLKWTVYLRALDVRVSARASRRVFLAGLAMTITPGKAGEFLKSFALRDLCGVPVSRTAPVVVAERLTDGVAMVLLASVGAWSFGRGRAVLVATLVALLAALVLLAHPAPLAWCAARLARVPRLARPLDWILRFRKSAGELLRPRLLVFAVGTGLVSWGLEGLVVFVALQALGGSIPVAASVFVVSFSSILGAVSALPGGLVAAEGSILALLLWLGLTREMGVAVTLVTRVSTLWLGVALGLVGLVLLSRLSPET